MVISTWNSQITHRVWVGAATPPLCTILLLHTPHKHLTHEQPAQSTTLSKLDAWGEPCGGVCTPRQCGPTAIPGRCKSWARRLQSSKIAIIREDNMIPNFIFCFRSTEWDQFLFSKRIYDANTKKRETYPKTLNLWVHFWRIPWVFRFISAILVKFLGQNCILSAWKFSQKHLKKVGLHPRTKIYPRKFTKWF